MRRSNRSLLIIVAVICFAIAVMIHGGLFTLDNRIDWTNLGLFFGFLGLIY
jgi:hypothetical protein